jgi:hypothetical protein
MLDRLKETGAEFLFVVPTHAIDPLSEMRDVEMRIPRRARVAAGFGVDLVKPNLTTGRDKCPLSAPSLPSSPPTWRGTRV